MNAIAICVAAAALGIDVGWQRLPEGGMEYIIQLDPQAIEVLRAGEPIYSNVPPDAGEVRSYRIVVGKAKLPRDTPPPAPAPAPKPAEPKGFEPKASQPAAPYPLPTDPGGKPLAERPIHFMEHESTAATEKSPPKAAVDVEPETPGKPWLPLTFALFGLFASLGANVYLVWIAWDFRRRYLAKGGVRENRRLSIDIGATATGTVGIAHEAVSTSEEVVNPLSPGTQQLPALYAAAAHIIIEVFESFFVGILPRASRPRRIRLTHLHHLHLLRPYPRQAVLRRYPPRRSGFSLLRRRPCGEGAGPPLPFRLLVAAALQR